MSRFVVTLDTCVLVPSRLRDTLLDSARAGLYQCRWSEDTIDELRRTLAEKTSQPDRIEQLLDAIAEQFPDAVVRKRRYGRFVGTLTNHPKDRHVLAAAITSQSTVIVTENLRDFQPDALAPHAVLAQSAEAFLIRLLDQSPAQMLDVLQEQAAGYRRPPMTLDQLFDSLRRTVPAFVERVAQTSLQPPEEDQCYK